MAPTLLKPRSGKSASSSAKLTSTETASPVAASERQPLTPRVLNQWLARHGYPAYRAGQILSWAYRRRASTFAAMGNLPQALRADLEAEFVL
ncbi:MAG TPA: hypothetical protein VMT89_03615, partial [Candidatus Acidoferrales bacterium]|nr:hypothetical protein [Candidatus Acidoferrales bacterium]